MNNSCIIFGGSGFIGTHLSDFILKQGIHNKVLILDLVKPRIIDPGIEFLHCDVRRPIAIDLKDQYEVIYNLAALCKEPGYEYGEYFETNYIGSKNVCSFARKNGIKTIVFTSTMMVHQAGEDQMVESSPTHPDTAYGISKLLAEEVHRAWKAADPNRILRIVRPAVVFGKFDEGNFPRLYRLLKKRLFFYMGRKDTVKSCIYVKELVQFLVWCHSTSNSAEIYEFAFPEKITLQRTCEAICRTFGFQTPFLTMPYSWALGASYIFMALAKTGLLKTSIHPRRIQKLRFSTNIFPQNAIEADYKFHFTLDTALQDLKSDCGGMGIS